MKKIINLKDLLIEQIRELYSAERLQLKALHIMHEKTSSNKLKHALKNHKDETDQHIKRLKNIFNQLKVSTFGENSKAMEGLISEGYELIERSSDPEVLDAAIIASIQYMEHFEIAGYGSACTFAKELQLDDIAYQLHLTLQEEKEIDNLLSEIATEQINKKAIDPIIV